MAKEPKEAKKPKAPKKKAASGVAMSVSAHPRAADSVRRAKGYGGLFGLVLVGFLSLRAGALPIDAAARALLGGIAGYMVAWLISVQVWRHLVIAEVRAATQRLRGASDTGGGA